MPEIKSLLFRRAFFSLYIFAFSFAVPAQSTIFNVPSTDVMGEKRLYVEGAFNAHFDRWEKGGFQSFGFLTLYGVSKNLEAGANFFYTRTGGAASPKELQLNAKYKVYDKEKSGFAVATGAQLFVPLNRAAGDRTFGMIYLSASQTINKTKETRITGGFYTILGADKNFGTKNGALLGFEQPLTEKLTITADWYSGKNRFGYAAAGFGYSFTRRQYVQVGYNFGNAGRANNSLTALYGFTY